MDQDEAFDLVKTKLAFMEQQKVDERKKALQSGYDFEMLSYELLLLTNRSQRSGG